MKQLYKKDVMVDDNPLDLLLGEHINKLTDQVADQQAGELLYEKIYNVFKNMQNNKSPGLDGFNVAF